MMGRRRIDDSKPEYKFRPVSRAVTRRLSHLIVLVRREAKKGQRVRIDVENIRNTNGYSLRWEPATQSVKVSRYVSLSWCLDHGYRGW